MIDLVLPRTRMPCAWGLKLEKLTSELVLFKQIPIREVYVAGQHCPYLVLPIKLAANDLWLNCLAFGRFMNSMNHFLHWISQWLIGVFRHPKGMVLASAGGMVAFARRCCTEFRRFRRHKNFSSIGSSREVKTNWNQIIEYNESPLSYCCCCDILWC